MFIKTAIPAVVFIAMAHGAFAQSFTGGELTIDAYGFSDGDDPSAVNYSGALEYAINRNFSVSADLSIYDFSLFEDNINNAALHGIYHVNDVTSVGVFFGSEESNDDRASFFGLEGGYETAAVEVEAYFAVYDDDGNSNVLGLDGAYQFNDNISAIGTFGYGDVGDLDIRRYSAGAEYTFDNGPAVYAELGRIDAGDVDSNFIGIGASIAFGAERGTTFDRRGIFETLNPGF